MAPNYASATTVSPSKSREEIDSLITKYGADSVAYLTETGRAVIAFRMQGRQIRFMLQLPLEGESQFHLTPTRQVRSTDAAKKAWEQAVRQRWRALALMVKAKLEAVDSGIVTLEQEFAAHIVMPDGRTVYEHIQPQIEHAYETGAVRPLAIEGS